MYFENSIILSILGLLSIAGLITHSDIDYFAQSENVVNGPLVYGLVILIHSIFGASGVTEKPKVLDRFSNNVFAKFFILLLLAFTAVRDFEDTIFLSLLFLAVTQLLRSKEERKRHPYIL